LSSGFLLDTNVPSELTRPLPDDRVVAWVNAQDNSSLYLSVVSVGELRKGFCLLAEGNRRAQLEAWFETFLLPLFADRILPVTQAVGDRWGVLTAACQLRGAPLNTADGLIAATALEHDLTVVTRNVKDFEGLRVTVLNPWEDVL
jgi:predicted nucleic acid-binding protein